MPLATGAEAPDFALPDAEGRRRTRDDLAAGGPVLLAFFNTTCPTCRLAFPVYGELERRFGDVVPVVAVSQHPVGEARPWLDQLGFAGPVLDDDSDDFAVSAAYGVRSVPTLVLVEGGRVAAASEAWDRERVNQWARELAERAGREPAPVSTEDDGRPVFKPG
ncbi:MAG: TlpA family protein disulfide reductase [Actinomycetota bacterium]|nr:TlpA family protein disulfide reductase [Actinomycetota bacterium]